MPEADVEYRLAAKLIGKAEPLDRRIIEALVGGPQRYSELRALIGKRRDHVRTKALARLRSDGLIVQRLDLDANPPPMSYVLSQLGILVVLKLHEMVPVHESLEAARRGRLGSA